MMFVRQATLVIADSKVRILVGDFLSKLFSGDDEYFSKQVQNLRDLGYCEEMLDIMMEFYRCLKDNQYFGEHKVSQYFIKLKQQRTYLEDAINKKIMFQLILRFTNSNNDSLLEVFLQKMEEKDSRDVFKWSKELFEIGRWNQSLMCLQNTQPLFKRVITSYPDFAKQYYFHYAKSCMLSYKEQSIYQYLETSAKRDRKLIGQMAEFFQNSQEFLELAKQYAEDYNAQNGQSVYFLAFLAYCELIHGTVSKIRQKAKQIFQLIVRKPSLRKQIWHLQVWLCRIHRNFFTKEECRDLLAKLKSFEFEEAQTCFEVGLTCYHVKEYGDSLLYIKKAREVLKEGDQNVAKEINILEALNCLCLGDNKSPLLLLKKYQNRTLYFECLNHLIMVAEIARKCLPKERAEKIQKNINRAKYMRQSIQEKSLLIYLRPHHFVQQGYLKSIQLCQGLNARLLVKNTVILRLKYQFFTLFCRFIRGLYIENAFKQGRQWIWYLKKLLQRLQRFDPYESERLFIYFEKQTQFQEFQPFNLFDCRYI